MHIFRKSVFLVLSLLCVFQRESVAEGFSPIEWPQTSMKLMECPYGCADGEGDSSVYICYMDRAFNECVHTLWFRGNAEFMAYLPGELWFDDMTRQVGTGNCPGKIRY